jgi:hypothetical protein
MSPKMAATLAREVNSVKNWNYLEPDLDYTVGNTDLTLYWWQMLTSGSGGLKVKYVLLFSNK